MSSGMVEMGSSVTGEVRCANMAKYNNFSCACWRRRSREEAMGDGRVCIEKSEGAHTSDGRKCALAGT